MTKFVLFIVFLVVTSLGLLVLASSPWTTDAASGAPIRLGIMGDSNSDEYRAEDNRGGSYAATTLGWGEQLAKTLHWDIGAWGTRNDVRRSGFEYNWARTGDNSYELLAHSQHTGLAAQVAAGKIDLVILSIGSNDFAPYYNRYQPIYEGTLSGTALDNKLNEVFNNIMLAADTVHNAGQIKLLVVGVPDWGLGPTVIQQFPDANKRLRVSNALLKLNTKLHQAVTARGQLFLDQNKFGQETLLNKIDAQGNFSFGGEKINAVTGGDEPHHLQLGDSVHHGGTILEAIVANYYITAINQKWNLSLQTMSDTDVLINAGIKKIGCIEDINLDSYVDIDDYGIWASNVFRSSPTNIRADINRDNFVDIGDFNLISLKFLNQCSVAGPYAI